MDIILSSRNDVKYTVREAPYTGTGRTNYTDSPEEYEDLPKKKVFRPKKLPDYM